MSKVTPGQLDLDFNAPPRLPPMPRKPLSHEEARAQIERDVKSMKRKLIDLPGKTVRALRVRDPMGGVMAWKIDALLEVIPEFEFVAGFASPPSAMNQFEIMEQLDIPHGAVLFLIDARTKAVCMIADTSAEGVYQTLPLLA